MSNRIPIPETVAKEIIYKASNACCICQTPFVQIHHIDDDPTNNDPDNLIPLCLNHHALAQVKSGMFRNLTPSILKNFREKWYSYCEERRHNFGMGQDVRNGVCILKIKNFARKLGWANHSWSGTFASLNEEYRKMKQSELIDRVFSTSNPDEMKVYLETMAGLYDGFTGYSEDVITHFRDICNCFGFDYLKGEIISV